jgi:argininosuccinate lyase
MGYTHLQPAQRCFRTPLLAYWDMLGRDEERFSSCQERVNVLPLGSGALAGTTLPIDRAYVARLLAFPRISQNSIDAVSDRDFVLEFLSAAAILFVHLSRLAEELILWSSREFGFVELPDRYCTGSSMMPQKKNPDVIELIRGKSGRVFGHLHALLTIMKGLPLAYNRDLQEDKIPLFDTVDTVKSSLEMARDIIRGESEPRPHARRGAGQLMNARFMITWRAGVYASRRSSSGRVIVRHHRPRPRIEEYRLRPAFFCWV